MVHKRRFRVVGLSCAVVVAALMLFLPASPDVLPALLPLCPVQRAAAQENVCLAQEVTISAQEVQILQLQGTLNAREIELLEMRATVDAYEHRAGQPSAPLVITVPIVITATPNLRPTPIAQPTDFPVPDGCLLHTVKEGDFPSSIASDYGVELFELLDVNGLDEESASLLQIGDVLIIPTPGCSAADGDISAAAGVILPPTAVGAAVQIRDLLSPDDLMDEGVVIENTGITVNLAGWTLSDQDENTYSFPEIFLFSNARVTVNTRAGTKTPVAFFWGQDVPMWQSGEVVALRDASGAVQSVYRVP